MDSRHYLREHIIINQSDRATAPVIEFTSIAENRHYHRFIFEFPGGHFIVLYKVILLTPIINLLLFLTMAVAFIKTQKSMNLRKEFLILQ